jgi:hypothetical protein
MANKNPFETAGRFSLADGSGADVGEFRRPSPGPRAVPPKTPTTPPRAEIRSSVAKPPVQGWRDEFWTMLVGALDGVLRSCYSVVQFTDDPRCVFRIGQGQARHDLLFADGTVIDAGETIGTLHFWNEQLPPFSLSGPDLRWAVIMHRRVVYSLRALTQFLEIDPVWCGISAFRAEAALSSRIGDKQLERVTRRYGFECIDEPVSWQRHLHELGECCSAWGLARAYNPVALTHQRFFRPYHDLWLTRATLIARYGSGDDADGCAEPAADKAA